eukprot:03415.XXX_122659_123288_1 [CDS] Oithona nana genome sequencing.
MPEQLLSKTSHYRSMNWENLSPNGKLSCLEEAKILSRKHQFLLLIDSTVIIEDKSMMLKFNDFAITDGIKLSQIKLDFRLLRIIVLREA